MKKILMKTAVVAATFAPVLAFAAGEDETGTNVLNNVKAAAGAVQGAVADAANGAAPIIVAVIGIGVALWIIPTIVGVVKRAFGSGKGR